MKTKLLLILALLCLLGSGCRLYENFIRVSFIEPFQFPNNLDDWQSRGRFRWLAQNELRQRFEQSGRQPFSADYARGFEHAYVDFLEAGDSNYRPTVPPRRYWKSKYQTPAGRRAIEDWFRGYEDGALASQASGYRELVTVPTWDTLELTTQPNYPRRIRATQQPTNPVTRPASSSAVEPQASAVPDSFPSRLPPTFTTTSSTN